MLIEYDATHEKCPLPLVTVKRHLRNLSSNDVLKVRIKDKGSLEDIPKLLTSMSYPFECNQLAHSVTELIITGR